KGVDLQPEDGEDDKSRNSLAELLAGGFLKKQGLEVTPTESGEDFRCFFGGRSFAVEVKRPAGARTVGSNIKKLRRQLKTRRGTDLKMGVLVADRALGLGTKLTIVANPASLDMIQERQVPDLIRQ